jgi:hypothetical protein
MAAAIWLRDEFATQTNRTCRGRIARTRSAPSLQSFLTGPRTRSPESAGAPYAAPPRSEITPLSS